MPRDRISSMIGQDNRAELHLPDTDFLSENENDGYGALRNITVREITSVIFPSSPVYMAM